MHLPHFILAEILGYLELEDLFQSRTVDRFWYKIAEEVRYYKMPLTIDLNDEKFFSHLNPHMKKYRWVDFSVQYVPSEPGFGSRVEKLFDYLSNLCGIHIEVVSLSCLNVLVQAKQVKKLVYLELCCYNFWTDSLSTSLEFANLTFLKIHVPGFFNLNLRKFSCPLLKTLIFSAGYYFSVSKDITCSFPLLEYLLIFNVKDKEIHIGLAFNVKSNRIIALGNQYCDDHFYLSLHFNQSPSAAAVIPSEPLELWHPKTLHSFQYANSLNGSSSCFDSLKIVKIISKDPIQPNFFSNLSKAEAIYVDAPKVSDLILPSQVFCATSLVIKSKSNV